MTMFSVTSLTWPQLSICGLIIIFVAKNLPPSWRYALWELTTAIAGPFMCVCAYLIGLYIALKLLNAVFSAFLDFLF